MRTIVIRGLLAALLTALMGSGAWAQAMVPKEVATTLPRLPDGYTWRIWSINGQEFKGCYLARNGSGSLLTFIDSGKSRTPISGPNCNNGPGGKAFDGEYRGNDYAYYHWSDGYNVATGEFRHAAGGRSVFMPLTGTGQK